MVLPWFKSPAVAQVVGCAPVTQRARVRSPVGTSFLGEVFRGFSSPVRQMSGSFRPPRSPNIIWPSLLSILIHYGRQWPEMLTRPKTSNIHTYAMIQSSQRQSFLHFFVCFKSHQLGLCCSIHNLCLKVNMGLIERN